MLIAIGVLLLPGPFSGQIFCLSVCLSLDWCMYINTHFHLSLLKTVTSHQYHQFQSITIEFIQPFPYLHLSSTWETWLHYLYLLLWSTLLYIVNLPSLLPSRPLPRGPPYWCWHPLLGCLSTKTSFSPLPLCPTWHLLCGDTLSSLCKSSDSPLAVPVCGYRVLLAELWHLLWVIVALSSSGAKPPCPASPESLRTALFEKERDGNQKEEEEEELYALFNNKKPLTLTSLNKCWAIFKNSIGLKTCYIVGLPGHLVSLLSPGCQALLCMS